MLTVYKNAATLKLQRQVPQTLTAQTLIKDTGGRGAGGAKVREAETESGTQKEVSSGCVYTGMSEKKDT